MEIVDIVAILGLSTILLGSFTLLITVIGMSLREYTEFLEERRKHPKKD